MPKSNFLDKVLGRVGRLDAQGLHTVIQRLARERDFLEKLFNAVDDGVLVLDESGRILYFNRAVTRLLGLPQEGAEGQHIAEYLSELDWKRLSEMDQAGGPRVMRHELEVAYPRPRLLSVYVTPLDGEHAGSAGLALVIHDITEARQQTHAAIESERLHALTLLAASVAHEIGNPLNALHIHLQLMERELKKLKSISGQKPLDRGRARPQLRRLLRTRTSTAQSKAITDEAGEIAARLETYVSVAKGEIVRLDNIVTQFLQAIRPSAPQFRLASLNDVVRDTIKLIQPETDNRGIAIEQQLTRQLTETSIDPAQIKQALLNLAKNALYAMTKGGVLTFQTGHTSDGVWVSVADTGRGIPEEEVQRIFEPFYTTKKKGTGLGLMIVQRIVRDHGGRIELQSRVGQGTTFRIWLPLHERRPRLLGPGPEKTDQGRHD